ncbi:UDP-3-O-glucosamine N-acyltransferase [Auriscalpium vulgare]|uniref:UDP-3-O-glucosamine N-acyltransferase n=1 Tax=Auriscalpium vulgare TaxID=40419 RepID=A0ACB8S6V2_9AGAM|nr:UDP-3-O-glucosamine N-acyltransferase [Auriscalpium vulgare]
MDFEESSSTKLASREFLAVVLAGFGNELLPLTSDHGDEPCPKALLPIANRPMIDYPLTWLEQSGITEVLLICPTAHRSRISHHIHSDTSSSSYPSLHVDVQTYDETQNLTVGTCTVLKHFSHRIQQDFVLLPCDFIPPAGLTLTSLLNKYRIESHLDGAIVTACWYQAQRPEKGAVPEDWGSAPTAIPIVWDRQSGTLLHVDTLDDLDRNGEELELRMSLLSRYARTSLSSRYQDSHVYVCKKSVLDVLHRKAEFDSFREEFVPWLCKLHYQRTKQQKYSKTLQPSQANVSQVLALRHSTLYSGLTYGGHHPPDDSTDSPTHKPMPLSGPPSPIGHIDDGIPAVSLRVGLIVHEGGFAGRANNLPTLLELNRHFLSLTTYALPTDPENRSLINVKSQISNDSMVGTSTKVGERTTIKRSVIGKHCVIGRSVRIVGCILLDHCVVGDGAKLDGSILGKNTKVGAKAELVRCLTQAGYEVDAAGSFKHEKLEISDWTAGRDEDAGNEESDSGGDDETDEEE